MGEFLVHLKERKLVQWALAYAAAGFAFLQGLDLVAQRFGWPEVAERAAIVAVAIGFLVTLVLAWYHGERGRQRVSGTELAILALLLAIGGVLVWRVAPTPVAADKPAQAAAASAAARTPADANAARPSVAVLAFADLSPGKDHEYLADGVAEEILDALARLKGIHVAGRTSSFHFKGRDDDLRSIGAALGVANVLEGSVRTQDRKVRISAKLVRAADGFDLWSDVYEGTLDDVFRLEDNIARAIVRELAVVLASEDRSRLVDAATTSSEAYALYLRASGVLNRREQARYDDGVAWLEQAVRIDPRFARAFARLASLQAIRSPNPANVGAGAAAESAARRAIELDPKLAEPHAALARVFDETKRPLEGFAEAERALALNPDDPEANQVAAQLQILAGYFARGTQTLDHLLAIDPFMPNALFWRAMRALYSGDLAACERLLRRADEAGLSWVWLGWYRLAIARGDGAKALELLRGVPRATEQCGGVREADLPEAVQVLGPLDAAARTRWIALVDRCLASHPTRTPSWIPDSLMHYGETARALAALRSPVTNRVGTLWVAWSDDGRALRHSPGFVDFMRDYGYVAVWDRYGPPDGCRRTGDSAYECAD